MGRLLPKTGEGFFNICLASSYEISDIRMICRKCPDLRRSTPSTQATPNSTISSPQESNHGFLDTSSLYLKESSQVHKVHRSRIGGIQGCLSMCIYTVYCIAAVGVCIYEHVCMHIYIYISASGNNKLAKDLYTAPRKTVLLSLPLVLLNGRKCTS